MNSPLPAPRTHSRAFGPELRRLQPFRSGHLREKRDTASANPDCTGGICSGRVREAPLLRGGCFRRFSGGRRLYIFPALFLSQAPRLWLIQPPEALQRFLQSALRAVLLDNQRRLPFLIGWLSTIKYLWCGKSFIVSKATYKVSWIFSMR